MIISEPRYIPFGLHNPHEGGLLTFSNLDIGYLKQILYSILQKGPINF
jgi:hypothetical protein